MLVKLLPTLCREIDGNWYGHFFQALALSLMVFLAEAAESIAPPMVDAGIDTASAHSLLLEIYVNGQVTDQTSVIKQQADGRLLMSLKDLLNLRFLPPPSNALKKDEPDWVYLDALGLARVNSNTQTLWLDVLPDKFRQTELSADRAQAPTPKMPKPGAYLNYDIYAQGYQGSGHHVASRVEIGAFAEGWVAITRLVAPDIANSADVVRLDSTLTLDRPTHMDSVRVGDIVSGSGVWGRSAYMGGIQWASNFATRPEFITFPLPSFSGMAVLPSTADVFVNNVRAYHGDMPAGPFSLNTLPVITGQGEMQLVVRDVLGREQVIMQPYYASRELLKAGLHSFSYELGLQRHNLGKASNDYGGMYLSGTHRYGFTPNFTGEIHTELTPDVQTVGVAGATLISKLGVIDGAVAISQSDRGNGGLFSLGFDRRTRGISFGVTNDMHTSGFRYASQFYGMHIPKRQTRAYLGWSDADLGSFSFGYFDRDNRSQTDLRMVTANYNRNLWQGWFLNLNGIKGLNGAQDYAVGVSLTHAFGERTSGGIRANFRNDQDSLLFQAQKSLPPGNGWGYRLLAGMEKNERIEAGLDWQNDYGTYRVEAGRNREIDGYRASASGSLALLGGHAFLARHLGNSFAVVQVPGFADVQVYQENQPVARTDKSGVALVPRLRPYQRNRISIEQSDLPLDAQIDSLELSAVPYAHSGYGLAFPIRRAKAARLRMILKDGTPLPLGTVLRLNDEKVSFPMGLNGRTYLTGLEKHNHLRARLPDGRSCEVSLDVLFGNEPLLDIGTIYCLEIKP